MTTNLLKSSLARDIWGAPALGAFSSDGAITRTLQPLKDAPTSMLPQKGLFHSESGMYICEPAGIRL